MGGEIVRMIQFRGKSVATGDWVYGYLVPMKDGISGWAIAGDHCKVSNYAESGFTYPAIGAEEYCQVLNDTICEYVGLADSDDTPIYEGDIIAIHLQQLREQAGIVMFGTYQNPWSDETTHQGFYVEWIGEREGALRRDLAFWTSERRIRIVGNIYDNPELLINEKMQEKTMPKVKPGTYVVVRNREHHAVKPLPDLETVLANLRRCANDKHTYCDYRIERDGILDICACHEDLLSDAIRLLETLKPRVLEFGELMEYKGAVWPELTFGDGHHEIMPPCKPEGDVMSDGTTGLRSTSSILRMEYKQYKKTWRCWTQCPTEEQTKEEKWDE